MKVREWIPQTWTLDFFSKNPKTLTCDAISQVNQIAELGEILI